MNKSHMYALVRDRYHLDGGHMCAQGGECYAYCWDGVRLELAQLDQDLSICALSGV